MFSINVNLIPPNLLAKEKGAILSVPYEFFLFCRCFIVKEIRDLHGKESAKRDKAKIREILAPHLPQRGPSTARILLQSRLGRVSRIKSYSSLSGLIN
jgi:hypothetical protein